MHSTKSRGDTRRVWRMTAENQLGEILELPDESNAGRNRQGARSRSSRSKQATAPALFHDSTGFASRSTGDHAAPYTSDKLRRSLHLARFVVRLAARSHCA